MTYQQRVNKIRKALIDAIKACEQKINEIGKHPRGTSPINGIAVEIIPFQQTFSIHLRDDSDEKNNEYPEWKYWEFYEGHKENEQLLKYLENEYETSENGEKYMLMLNTAIADALMCDEIVEILRSYSIGKYCKINELGNSPFDFVVLDLDECVQANFCDIIRWKRNILEEALNVS